MVFLAAANGALALTATVAAGVALAIALALAVVVMRMRRAQTAVLGSAGERDLVSHAEAMQTGFDALEEMVEDAVARVQQRNKDNEVLLGRCITHTAVVRYDAWGELTGRQSSSIALFDSHRNGVVMSSIVHRDQARLYVKQLREGVAEYELSPEEEEAIKAALAHSATPAAPTAEPHPPAHRRGTEPEAAAG